MTYFLPLIIPIILFNLIIVYYINDYDKAFYHIFGSMCIAFPIGGLLMLSLVKSDVVGCKFVTDIGGCNKINCGVRYSDGSIGAIPTPVLGQKTCEMELHWRWE